MKKRSSKQANIRIQPLNAERELWREIPEDLQGKVRGGNGETLAFLIGINADSISETDFR